MIGKNVAGVTSMSPEINQETLSFILDFTKDAPENLIKDAGFLDTKMVNILTAASVVISLGGLSVRGISGGWYIKLLLGIALVAYWCVVAMAIKILKPRDFSHSRHADTLWQEHYGQDLADVKHALVQDISMGYAENKNAVKEKAKHIRYALLGLAIEVGVIIFAIILAL